MADEADKSEEADESSADGSVLSTHDIVFAHLARYPEVVDKVIGAKVIGDVDEVLSHLVETLVQHFGPPALV